MTAPDVPLIGRLVRTVQWEGETKFVSPTLTVMRPFASYRGQATYVLAGEDRCELMAYAAELEIVGVERAA